MAPKSYCNYKIFNSRIKEFKIHKIELTQNVIFNLLFQQKFSLQNFIDWF